MSGQQKERIQIGGDTFEQYLSAQSIDRRTNELAYRIANRYEGRPLHVIAVAVGGLVFANDLTRAVQTLSPNMEISHDVVRFSSYQNGTTSSGTIREVSSLTEPIGGRDLLVIEDIVDSGNTLNFFLKKLAIGDITHTNEGTQNIPPETVAVAALLNKPLKNKGRVIVNYCGFDIPDLWVAGRGMDHKGLGRSHPHIYQKIED